MLYTLQRIHLLLSAKRSRIVYTSFLRLSEGVKSPAQMPFRLFFHRKSNRKGWVVCSDGTEFQLLTLMASKPLYTPQTAVAHARRTSHFVVHAMPGLCCCALAFVFEGAMSWKCTRRKDDRG